MSCNGVCVLCPFDCSKTEIIYENEEEKKEDKEEFEVKKTITGKLKVRKVEGTNYIALPQK